MLYVNKKKKTDRRCAETLVVYEAHLLKKGVQAIIMLCSESVSIDSNMSPITESAQQTGGDNCHTAAHFFVHRTHTVLKTPTMRL